MEDTSSQAARTNAIIQSFIDILNNPAAFEENTTTSNFENVKEANETYAEIVGANKTTVAPSDFFTQLDWFDAATSGIKLKGISVNRDTFMSIGNVTKANHSEGIKVMYTTNVISEQKLLIDMVKKMLKLLVINIFVLLIRILVGLEMIRMLMAI